uniref:hypothetical protein n=1 Tax=Trichocoleus desertorum TaxID=1481672 RepID=UPI0025B546DC|nr:hypothetical protein [Trichocoleus desertorum]
MYKLLILSFLLNVAFWISNFFYIDNLRGEYTEDKVALILSTFTFIVLLYTFIVFLKSGKKADSDRIAGILVCFQIPAIALLPFFIVGYLIFYPSGETSFVSNYLSPKQQQSITIRSFEVGNGTCIHSVYLNKLIFEKRLGSFELDPGIFSNSKICDIRNRTTVEWKDEANFEVKVDNKTQLRSSLSLS